MTTSSPTTLADTQVNLGYGMVVPLSEAIRRLRCLPPLERNVLSLRLGLIGRPRSAAQTAALLGITPQKVRSIERFAGSRVRHPSVMA